MAWIDVPFPKRIALGAISNSSWAVSVSSNIAQFEQRNLLSTFARHDYDVSHAVRTEADFHEVRAHFHMARGRYHTFPFMDPVDHRAEQSSGFVKATSATTLQLFKRYGFGGFEYDRKITRPRADTFALYSGNTLLAANRYTLDSTTGGLTLAADQTRSNQSHAQGANHQITMSGVMNPPPMPGDEVVISGVTGTAAAALNGRRTVVTVNNAVITVQVNTSGLTATGGTVSLGPQLATLRWSGEFWTPCRYNILSLPMQAINRRGSEGELLIAAESLLLVEVRE